MNRTTDVIVVGELNVDMILNGIHGFPEMGKEILADQFTLTMGSSSAICACNLSSLGTRVGFKGKLGRDSFGEVIKKTFRERGVDTRLLIETSDYNTGLTVVLNYDQDRAMVTYPGAMEQLAAAEIGDEELSQAGHLHVSSVFLQPALKKDLVSLFSRARNLGLTTSLDAQWDPAEKWDLDLFQLLPHVNVFLPNEKEFRLLTRCASVREGLTKLQDHAQVIAIKNGKDGALLWADGKVIEQDAFYNDQVADCIGAGDSFNAGFLHQFVRQQPLIKCLEFGNLTGAINTTAAGGTTAFQSYERIQTVARDKFSYSLEE